MSGSTNGSGGGSGGAWRPGEREFEAMMRQLDAAVMPLSALICSEQNVPHIWLCLAKRIVFHCINAEMYAK